MLETVIVVTFESTYAPTYVRVFKDEESAIASIHDDYDNHLDRCSWKINEIDDTGYCLDSGNEIYSANMDTITVE